MGNALSNRITPKKIIIHHAGEDDGPALQWSAFRRYHVEHNGWLDIGYHAGVELVGDSYEVLMGRPWWMKGAHTLGQNDVALGFCFVGNFNEDFLGEDQLVAGAKLLKTWMLLYDIGEDAIFPHNHFNATDCPGINLDISEIKAAIREVGG